MLQNGKLPRFLKEERSADIFSSSSPSPCMLAVQNGLRELAIFQVSYLCSNGTTQIYVNKGSPIVTFHVDKLVSDIS